MPSRAFADFSQAVRGCEGAFGLRTSLFRKLRNICEKGRATESSRKRADRKEEVVNFHFSSSCLSHFARSLSLWRFWGKGCPWERGAANLRIPGMRPRFLPAPSEGEGAGRSRGVCETFFSVSENQGCGLGSIFTGVSRKRAMFGVSGFRKENHHAQ